MSAPPLCPPRRARGPNGEWGHVTCVQDLQAGLRGMCSGATKASQTIRQDFLYIPELCTVGQHRSGLLLRHVCDVILVRLQVHLVRRRYNLANSLWRRVSVVLRSDLPVSLRNLDVDKTLLRHHGAATSACYANKSRSETKKKCCKKRCSRTAACIFSRRQTSWCRYCGTQQPPGLKTFKSSLWKCTPLPQILRSQCPGTCAPIKAP